MKIYVDSIGKPDTITHVPSTNNGHTDRHTGV